MGWKLNAIIIAVTYFATAEVLDRLDENTGYFVFDANERHLWVDNATKQHLENAFMAITITRDPHWIEFIDEQHKLHYTLNTRPMRWVMFSTVSCLSSIGAAFSRIFIPTFKYDWLGNQVKPLQGEVTHVLSCLLTFFMTTIWELSKFILGGLWHGVPT